MSHLTLRYVQRIPDHSCDVNIPVVNEPRPNTAQDTTSQEESFDRRETSVSQDSASRYNWPVMDLRGPIEEFISQQLVNYDIFRILKSRRIGSKFPPCWEAEKVSSFQSMKDSMFWLRMNFLSLCIAVLFSYLVYELYGLSLTGFTVFLVIFLTCILNMVAHKYMYHKHKALYDVLKDLTIPEKLFLSKAYQNSSEYIGVHEFLKLIRKVNTELAQRKFLYLKKEHEHLLKMRRATCNYEHQENLVPYVINEKRIDEVEKEMAYLLEEYKVDTQDQPGLIAQELDDYWNFNYLKFMPVPQGNPKTNWFPRENVSPSGGFFSSFFHRNKKRKHLPPSLAYGKRRKPGDFRVAPKLETSRDSSRTNQSNTSQESRTNQLCCSCQSPIYIGPQRDPTVVYYDEYPVPTDYPPYQRRKPHYGLNNMREVKTLMADFEQAIINNPVSYCFHPGEIEKYRKYLSVPVGCGYKDYLDMWDKVIYTPSPLYAAKVNYTIEEPSALPLNHSVWKRFNISPTKAVTWIGNVRLWIAKNILHEIVKEIDNVNNKLRSLGLYEVNIGSAGLDILLSTAHNPLVVQNVPTFALLIPFLQISTNQRYVTHRLRELADGSTMRNFSWKSGGKVDDKAWEPNLPTDAELVMHLFVTYLDCRLPITIENPDRRPFSSIHFLKTSDVHVPKYRDIAIYQQRCSPPCFQLIIKNECIDVPSGSYNIFIVIVVFLNYIKTKQDSMLGRLHLGQSGLNILWAIEDDARI